MSRRSLAAAPTEITPASLMGHLGTHRDVFALPLEAMTPAAFKKTVA